MNSIYDIYYFISWYSKKCINSSLIFFLSIYEIIWKDHYTHSLTFARTLKQFTMLPSTRPSFFLLLEKLSLVRQPLKEKRHRDYFCFLFFLRWQRKSTPTRRENAARKKDPPRSGSLHVFCCCSPWQMITDLFFRCHHDLLVQCAWEDIRSCFVAAVALMRSKDTDITRYNVADGETRETCSDTTYITPGRLHYSLNWIGEFHRFIVEDEGTFFLGINPIIIIFFYMKRLYRDWDCRDKFWNIFQ